MVKHPARRVTSREVAERAGVSRTTVSLVLNSIANTNISRETRERVFRVAEELGYVPNAAAQALVGIAPPGLDRVAFAAGGGDAVDCALKMARGATGRATIVSTVKAYHGHTGLALSANGKPHYREYCEPLGPGFRFVPFNDLDAMAAVVDDGTAAVIVEPVQGEAGIFVGTPEYLAGLRDLCDRHGALLIFDEIQTGWCRTGRMFACEHSGVVPDIMTVAKSLGGGVFPSAAVLYRGTPALAAFVDADPWFHRSVGGGSDLACQVSLAVIRYLKDHRVWENAAAQGAKLKEALEPHQALMATNAPAPLELLAPAKNAAFGIAATGSLVVAADRAGGRSVSLLPPVHAALLPIRSLLATPADLWRHMGEAFPGGPPSQVVVITGPSRTSDIELVLVRGVHGPGHVWVGLLEDV